MYLGYARGLRDYLARRLTPEAARETVRSGLAGREASFLRLLSDAVFARPDGPYGRLFAHAGIEPGDVCALVGEAGLEGALERLHDAGVYLTLDEFKGRQPVRRGGLEMAVGPEDFDNPVAARHLSVQTSGSRGARRAVAVDLALLAREAAHQSVYLDAFDLRERRLAMWRGVPPVGSGIKLALRYAKLGKGLERWFAQNRLPPSADTLGYRLTTRLTVRMTRRLGQPVPAPEYVHQDRAVVIARWLAERTGAGAPAHLDTNASSGVRVCLAADEAGLDVSGTFFRFGGEPFTEAKDAVVTAAGARAVCQYAMEEVGHLATPCAAPAGHDDMHLLADKLALIQRERPVGGTGARVTALVFTTLAPSTSKLMINVESDDYGRVERRECGCGVGRLGLDVHLSGIRSYEKLTSEGMSYLGADLVGLVEEVLPARFGGHPTHYQLVEEEERGIPKVSLVVSPAVGAVDEAALVATVHEALAASPGGPLMAEFWRDAGTVRVVRREPYATGSAKILPLHVSR